MSDFEYFCSIVFNIKGDSIVSNTEAIFPELKIGKMLRKIKR